MQAPLFGERLGQAEDDENRIEQRERAASKIEGHLVAPSPRRSADRRAENEAEPKGHADEAHRPRSLLARRHIGDAGLRRGDVAAARAIDDAAEKEHPRRIRRASDKVADGCPQNADQQHRLAPHAIGELADDWRREELDQGKDAHEPAKLGGAEMERGVLRVDRQHRDHDPEADHADEDREEDDAERRARFGGIGGHRSAK